MVPRLLLLLLCLLAAGIGGTGDEDGLGELVLLDPVATREVRVTGGRGTAIVLVVEDVEEWSLLSVSPASPELLKFKPGRREASKHKFDTDVLLRPEFTVIEDEGRAVVKLHANSTDTVYTVDIQINSSKSKTTLRSVGDEESMGFLERVMRKLMGSNCVEVELGKVSQYYTCVGCVAEEALGCIDDLRNNKSGNVGAQCQMNKVREGNQKQPMEVRQQQACCPLFSPGGSLLYKQSAFVTALQCITAAGCVGSRTYIDLLNECSHMCDRVSKEKWEKQQEDPNYKDTQTNGWFDDTLELQNVGNAGSPWAGAVPATVGGSTLADAVAFAFDKKKSVCLSAFSAGSRVQSSWLWPAALTTSLALFFLVEL
jgi:hypothetical protein